MGFQKKRFSFEANELEDIKLKTLIGKSSYNQNDFTKRLSLLIDDAYANSRGKKIRGM